MRVEQLMSQPVHTCAEHDTLNTAAGMMWDHDCGTIPVTGKDGVLVGMITDRDICMAAYTRGQCLSEIPVGEVMAKQVFACMPKDSLEAAERLMSEKQIRRVPVIDGQRRPIGILSMNDVARNAVSAEVAEDRSEHEVVETLAAISAPRQVSLQRVASDRSSTVQA